MSELLSSAPPLLIILARTFLAAACVLAVVTPAWWLAGRISNDTPSAFFRFLCASGLALVGYISFVNLAGRLLGNSIVAAILYFALNAVASILLWRRRPAETDPSPLVSTWRDWIAPVSLAVVLGFPQWLLAVSNNFFDEAASSAIHLTAANQFAEGVFPPRHNALPDVSIKYHYAFTILSGTVHWLTGLSANVSIDLVSTALWLFVFLFVFFWFRRLAFDRFAATWAGFSVLLGGGLSWAYLPRIEGYNGVEKVPPSSDMVYHHDAARPWLDNLIAAGRVPSLHLRNTDGSISSLPWDIAAQFQQHAVALGIALVLVALFLFVEWQQRQGLQLPLLVANVITFSVLFLAHSVFGAVAALTTGMILLASWVRRPTRWRFGRGLCFGIGVALLALGHGGMLARGPQYGADAVATFRHGLGYPAGGLGGFLHWNVAGFGLPLLLALLAWAFHIGRRDFEHGAESSKRATLFAVLTVFAFVSFFVPQLVFYSSETSGIEQFTEISKFFFAAHLALALLSAYAISRLRQWIPWGAMLPGFACMAITPLAFMYSGAFTPDHTWSGFYRSPYKRGSVEEQMGQTLGKLKHGNRDVYFDASADERVHGYLGELLIYAGSIFTLTPSRYERTGIGYRLSEDVIARRFVQNGRMARLLPGAAEGCDCRWYYSRPVEDMALSPLIVRSRFAKLVGDGYFHERYEAAPRSLFSIDRPTQDADDGLEKYWRPRVVSQSRAGARADKNTKLIFFDLVARRVLAGNDVIQLPSWLMGEVVQVYSARLPGDQDVSLLFGRMKDTEFHLGKRIDDLVERSGWAWTRHDARTGTWEPESERWLWDWDTPFIADINGDGFDSQIAYRHRTGEWMVAPNQPVNGPRVAETDLPLPLAGRFLPRSKGDLGLWSLRTGMVTLQTIATGTRVEFKWGGRPGDILVPGDYDGDGYDEIAVWQRSNHTWYWRHAPDGPITQAVFGTETSVPLPADYNHDGTLDLAYWEPREGKIYVSFTQGRSIDLTIAVPPHSVPAFVNMY